MEKKMPGGGQDKGRGGSETASADRTIGGPPPAPEAVHVLVAEDNPVSARIIDMFLTRMGCIVTVVGDGREALRVAVGGKFSVAIVDLSMPEMDGIEFTLQYRRHEAHGNHLPIVALTADRREEVKNQCRGVGMDGFLTKPVIYDQLVSVIRQHARGVPAVS